MKLTLLRYKKCCIIISYGIGIYEQENNNSNWKIKIHLTKICLNGSITITIPLSVKVAFFNNSTNSNITTIDRIGDNAIIPINQSNNVYINYWSLGLYLMLLIILILTIIILSQPKNNENN
jgi:hypothetical protein